MILEQLMEKKDAYIYIDLRINHLYGLVNHHNILFKVNETLVDPMFESLTKNQLKKLHREKKDWLAQIKELRKLKQIISEGKLKSQAKVYWKQQHG